ncbi:hypothetical protein [Sulfitobacter sp.]|uniref:hypothetical protein n=1 Tax=Sulfitobacter sp. TaxID=1903071 RepID=UPI003001F3A9
MKEHQDERSLKLVEMIYRAALDPQDYDGFMASWNGWIDARMTGLDKLRMSDPAMSSPEIAAHFELALRLLERIGEPAENTPSAGPRLLVHPSGQILWQNAAADRSFGSQRQSKVLEHQMSDTHRGALELFLKALGEEESPNPVVIQIMPTDSTRAIAFRLEAMRRVPTETVALLSALAPPWLSATDRLLADTHGLSESECAICALLADGMAPAAIAQQRWHFCRDSAYADKKHPVKNTNQLPDRACFPSPHHAAHGRNAALSRACARLRCRSVDGWWSSEVVLLFRTVLRFG